MCRRDCWIPAHPMTPAIPEKQPKSALTPVRHRRIKGVSISPSVGGRKVAAAIVLEIRKRSLSLKPCTCNQGHHFSEQVRIKTLC